MYEVEGGQVENHLAFYSGLLAPCSAAHGEDSQAWLGTKRTTWSSSSEFPIPRGFASPCSMPSVSFHSCSEPCCKHSPNFFSVSPSSSTGKVQLILVQGMSPVPYWPRAMPSISIGPFSISAGAGDEQGVDTVLDPLPAAVSCNTKDSIYRGAENTWWRSDLGFFSEIWEPVILLTGKTLYKSWRCHVIRSLGYRLRHTYTKSYALFICYPNLFYLFF